MQNKKGKILALLKKAEAELKLYNKYHRFTNLSQACEKTWVAFVLLLELRSGKEIRGTGSIYPIAEEFGLEGLFIQAKSLHIAHYEGSPAMEDKDTNHTIRYVISAVRFSL